MAAVVSEWDEVWAEYDARQAPPVPPAPVRPPLVEGGRRGGGVLLALAAAMAVLALGAAMSPVPAMLDLARSFRDGDAPAIAARTDQPALAAALGEALRREAGLHHPAGLNPFLSVMAEELADRMAAPEGMAGALPAGPAVAPHRLVRDVVPLGLDRWQVTLAAPGVPQRQAQLTLELAGPMRWQVVAAALPSAAR